MRIWCISRDSSLVCSSAAHSFDCPVLPSANKRRKQPTALNPSPPTLHLLHIPLAPIIYIRNIRMVFGKKQPAPDPIIEHFAHCDNDRNDVEYF